MDNDKNNIKENEYKWDLEKLRRLAQEIKKLEDEHEKEKVPSLKECPQI